MKFKPPNRTKRAPSPTVRFIAASGFVQGANTSATPCSGSRGINVERALKYRTATDNAANSVTSSQRRDDREEEGKTDVRPNSQ